MDSVIEEVEARYRGERSIEGTIMFLYSGEAELVDVNAAGVAFLEADDRSDLLGSSPGDFTHPDSRPEVERRRERLFVDREPVPPVEEVFIDMNGHVKPAVVASTPLTIKGSPAVLTVAAPAEEAGSLTPSDEEVAFEDIYGNVKGLMDDLYGPEERLELSGSAPDSDGPAGPGIPTSVRREGDTVHVSADLPDVAREDIRLQCDGEVLVIRAAGLGEERSERLLLPVAVDLTDASASYHNGVVRIRFAVADGASG